LDHFIANTAGRYYAQFIVIW